MTQQHGQTAATSASVLEMLKQARATGKRFSHTERMLYTACEFRVAAVSHSLGRYLGIIPKVDLLDAEAAFAAIEIPLVAGILRDARINSLMERSSGRTAEVVARLQIMLDHLEEPVDDMIRKFAVEQTWSRLKRPTFQAIESPDTVRAETESR